MSKAIVSRVITFASADPHGDCDRVMLLHRHGAHWAAAEGDADGPHAVRVKVRVGSPAERYALVLEARGGRLAAAN